MARFIKAREDRSWSDYDKSAMKTPWGPAQGGYQLATGVWWFSTAGHGGLMVRAGVAAKKLSGAARKMGMLWAGAFWYEEDVAYAIPFYENQDWADMMTRKAGGSHQTHEQLEHIVRQWFPEYFKHLEQGVQMPRMPKVGDNLEFKETVRYGNGITFQPGDVVQVVKVTPAMIVFRSDKFQWTNFKIQARYVYEGKLTKAASRKLAYNALTFQSFLPDKRATMWVLKYVTNLSEWAEFFYVAFKFALRDTSLATRFMRFCKMIGVEITPPGPDTHPSFTYFNPHMYSEQKKRLGTDPKVVMAVAVAVLVKLMEKPVAVKVITVFKDLLPEGIEEAQVAKKMTSAQRFVATVTPETKALAGKVWDALGNNPEAAKAYAFAVAEDANWHSLEIPGLTAYDYPEIQPYPSDISGQYEWSLEPIAAFIVALLALAGQKGAAQSVMRQALKEFAESYQPGGWSDNYI